MTSCAICSIVASPCPVVTVGSGNADIVAELSWLNCSTEAGAAPVLTVTSDDSGTIAPDALRTK